MAIVVAAKTEALVVMTIVIVTIVMVMANTQAAVMRCSDSLSAESTAPPLCLEDDDDEGDADR